MPRLVHARTAEQNTARWRRLVLDYRSSELSQREYCAERGITLSSFTRWRRLIADTSPTVTASEIVESAPGDGFVCVRVTPAPEANSLPTLSVELLSGVRIENIDAQNVAVVAALAAVL